MKVPILCFCLSIAIFYGCSTSQQVAQQPTPTPDQPVDSVDFNALQKPPQAWHHLDEQQTQFRGISSQRAYANLLKDKSPQKEIIVAVIDGGVDSDHEDLKEVMWVNEDEVPDNNKDDDQNGYTDDLHGWNFIGGPDGKSVDDDTFELTRIYRELSAKFGNVDTTQISGSEAEEYAYYQEIKSDYTEEIEKLVSQYSNIQSLEQSMNEAQQVLQQHFGDTTYTHDQVQSLQPTNRQLAFAQNVMSYVMENDIDSTLIADQKKQIYEFAKYGYNPDFNPRHIVGDNYEDKTERYYGNNDVAGPDASHGTHVAGIIAAERNNGIGMDGVSTNTRIMAIRAVPNGDERDKDVANAIRYAVDNGANIINMSFGKGYSPHQDIVNEAIKYADDHGVLMVHGAGNEASNTDSIPSYPTDQFSSDSSAELWLSVGATSWKPNEEFIANFSNYGNQTVDIFAPGVAIYSTMPDDKYKRQDGTSMASPVVAGVAALIMTYYPKLTPQQVRQIIIDSTVKYSNQMVDLPTSGNPDQAKQILFPELSASDGLINVYRALQSAEKMSQ
ncbi:S8 family peptidase [Fodinibius salsisoli]|uniref:S8 family peptidase n=1 Tax=Fodinibius salsisoli TaxID=2820877 RepID=A0ABT3PLS1_9BACT|nr:S8 family peptidase [Fodinibius salsisoli]MCW9706134.1 S8 family peptidase [Fodinibius salsisoli]